MADPSGYVVRLGDVDTLAFPWGTLHFTCSPLVNGANRLSAGIVVMKPGEGHGRHNHPGTEEIIQVLSGSGKQMVEDEHGNPILHDVEQGRDQSTRQSTQRPAHSSATDRSGCADACGVAADRDPGCD